MYFFTCKLNGEDSPQPKDSNSALMNARILAPSNIENYQTMLEATDFSIFKSESRENKLKKQIAALFHETVNNADQTRRYYTVIIVAHRRRLQTIVIIKLFYLQKSRNRCHS